MSRKIVICVCSLIAMFSSVARAAPDSSLPDPTKPAIVEFKPGDGENGGPMGLVLQSVIQRKGQKSGAIISGQMVEVGQEIGGARLIRVTETEVTLASDSGKEVLKLNPAVEKKPVIEKTQVKSMVSTPKKTAGKAMP